MKKCASLVAMLVAIVSLQSMGQTTLPNAGMENWHSVASYENPVDWQSTNEGTILVGVTGVTKSIDALDGLYAARLESKLLPFVNLVAPGGISTGVLDIANTNFIKGLPLTDPNPAGIIGYYKFLPVGGDSCMVYSALFRWDTVNNKRDTTAVALFLGGAASSYTMFDAPFVQLEAFTPDSQIVTVVNAVNYATAHAGTVMFVDDIDFTNSVGVPAIQNLALTLYPNPADEMLAFALPEEIHAQSIVISNVAGTMVKELRIMANEIKMNTSAFAGGTYVVFAKNVDGNIVASGKFTVKH